MSTTMITLEASVGIEWEPETVQVEGLADGLTAYMAALQLLPTDGTVVVRWQTNDEQGFNLNLIFEGTAQDMFPFLAKLAESGLTGYHVTVDGTLTPYQQTAIDVYRIVGFHIED